MEKVITVLEILLPIFAAIGLGILAKRKNLFSEEGNQGLQQFVMKFCLPCVLFNSCLSGTFRMDSITAMLLVFSMILLSTLLSFRLRKKRYPYHNLPQLFCAQESGMLGIPLFMTLFGAASAFHVGVLDIAQNIICVPVIAILTADTGKNPSPRTIVKKVLLSPLFLMSLLGLVLNLTGAMQVLNDIRIGKIITDTTGFLAQPVSAVILFCVGYNFSLGKDNRKDIFQLCVLHFCLFALFCGIIQGVLCFVPNVSAETRWSILLYCSLPGSYLAAGLGKTKEDSAVAASVCSILTVSCLIVFCIMAAIVA